MSGVEILIGVGVALSAGSQIIAAKQEKKARRAQAASEREAAAAEESDFRRQQRRLLATRRAGAAASGIASTGTPLIVDTAILEEIEVGAGRIRRAGSQRARTLEKEASNAQTNALFGAGTTLLTGASDVGFFE